MKLSVVIITYNEEKNIARCIDSVVLIADEIVVVDSFSTDHTKEICMSKGVKFIAHSFEGYIEQKNYALTQAAHPLILSLDADEALSDELRKTIGQLKTQAACDGYTMNRRTNYCGKWIYHCGWYPDKKLRLWKAGNGAWGGTNPHDTFIMHKDTTIAHLYGDILHYSYYSIQEHLTQIEKFSSIGAQALHKKGVKSNLFKRFLHPLSRFIKLYFLQMGFLDGRYGFIISKNSALANYKKYHKLYLLNKNDSL